MADKPAWVWDPSPNYWVGRNGLHPLAIVMHIEEGTERGTDEWFAEKASHVSAHYSVAKDGTIRCHVLPENTAWANGVYGNPDLSIEWLREAYERSINPNFLTISIEHEGRHNEPHPAAQIQATIALTRWLCETYGIKPDPDHILGHDRLDSLNRANCPGPTFPWERIFDALKTPIAGEAPKKPVEPPNPSEGVDVPEPKTEATSASNEGGPVPMDVQTLPPGLRRRILGYVTGSVDAASDQFLFTLEVEGAPVPQPFLLDTGAFAACICKATADYLASVGVELPNEGDITVGGVTGSSPAYLSHIRVRIPGLGVQTVPCVVDPSDVAGPNLFGLRWFVQNRYSLELDIGSGHLVIFTGLAGYLPQGVNGTGPEVAAKGGAA